VSTSIADQLRPRLEEWARQVVTDAGSNLFAQTLDRCPVGHDPESGVETVALKRSGHGEYEGDFLFVIGYSSESPYGEDYASFTDEGTEAHPITPRDTNPSGLLSFFWERLGHRVALPFVMWEPGEGVAQNIGWFSDICTLDNWQQQLQLSADSIPLG